MSKGYLIIAYQAILDEERMRAYSKLAVPAITAAGGRVLAGGSALRSYEAGRVEKTVLIEFSSVEEAIAAYEGPGYQAALAVLGDAARRDVRVLRGLD